ncbi:hypothetical protein HYR99_17125 [Candidatus Poribacteria bacterium]|nr:hypothetical protein [Candidatus Poribacteria bacterium]
MRGFAHKEIDALFQNIDQALKKLNRELPQLLENMGGIAASRQQIHLKLKPMNHKPKKEQMMNQCAASAVSRSVRNDMNC